jgi:hypothetical protein
MEQVNEIPVDKNTNDNLDKTNELIDKMTLELLMNKSQYQKYISQTNPKRFQEIQEYTNDIHKYKNSINDVTFHLLNNTKQYNNEIKENFDAYMKSLIRFFKMKEIENTNEFNRSNQDEDILFGNMDVDLENNLEDNGVKSSSFWSNERVVKKPFYFGNILSKR